LRSSVWENRTKTLVHVQRYFSHDLFFFSTLFLLLLFVTCWQSGDKTFRPIECVLSSGRGRQRSALSQSLPTTLSINMHASRSVMIVSQSMTDYPHLWMTLFEWRIDGDHVRAKTILSSMRHVIVSFHWSRIQARSMALAHDPWQERICVFETL
jgi:hypothetical protein